MEISILVCTKFNEVCLLDEELEKCCRDEGQEQSENILLDFGDQPLLTEHT